MQELIDDLINGEGSGLGLGDNAAAAAEDSESEDDECSSVVEFTDRLHESWSCLLFLNVLEDRDFRTTAYFKGQVIMLKFLHKIICNSLANQFLFPGPLYSSSRLIKLQELKQLIRKVNTEMFKVPVVIHYTAKGIQYANVKLILRPHYIVIR